jgi:hypothetical protein
LDLQAAELVDARRDADGAEQSANYYYLDVLSGGFPVSLSEDAVLELENAYVPFSRILAGKVEDVVLPQRD